MPRKAISSLLASSALAVVLAGCGSGHLGQELAAPATPTVTGAPGIDDQVETGESGPLDQWVPITDEPSGARFSLPTDAEPMEDTATVEDGSHVELRNYSSIAMGGVVEVGFNIIDTEGTGYDLEAGVDGVANTLDGEVVSAVDTEVDGSPAVDVEMTYGEDQVVLFQLVSTDDHVLQTLASGPESAREAVEITYQKLNESLEVD